MSPTGVPLGLSWLPPLVGNWVPGVRPLEPFLTFNFAVEIEGLLVGGFTEVHGLQSDLDVEDYREGGVNDFVHKLPGATRHGNIELRHGLTAVASLWNWHHDATRGIVRRRNGTIMLLDPQQLPVMWWNFRNALPVRWTGPTFDAGSDAVGVESIELAHEGLTMPALGQAAAAAHAAAGMAGM